MMMKITISTSARSSIGEMLMLSYTSLSPLSMEPDTITDSAVLFGDARDELVHEHAIVRGDGLDPRIEPVVAKKRGNGDRKSGDRRGERCGGSRCDRIDIDVAREC